MKCKGKKISKAKKISLLAAFSLFAAGAGVCAANAQKISYGGTAYAASESLQGNAFTFTPGASVRADEVKVDDVKVTGIRFEAEIGKEKYNALIDEKTNGFKENCEAGMIIVPADVLTKWERQKDAEDGKADIFEYIKRLGVDSSVSVSFLPENAEEKENNYLLRGVVNIKESNYLYDYQAAAYLKTDGTIVYDAFSTPRSLAYVANAAMLSDQETESKKTLLAEKLAKIVGMKFEKAGYTLGENEASLAISDLNAKINLADYFADITAEDLTFKLESGDKIANLSGTELTFNNIGEAAVKVTAYNGKFSYTVKINATNEKIAELYTKVSAGSSLTTKAYIEEETNDAVLKFSHRATQQAWGANAIHLKDLKNNIGENSYVKFQLKYDEPAEAEGASKTFHIWHNYGKNANGTQANRNINVGDYHWAGVTYYDAEGVAGRRGDGTTFTTPGAMKASEWYTYFVKIEATDLGGNDFYLRFYQFNSAPDGIEIPEFTGYIKNVEYVSEDSFAAAAKAAFTGKVSAFTTPQYYMDGDEAAFRVTHKSTSNTWGNIAVKFTNISAMSDEEKYVKFSFKVENWESNAKFNMFILNKYGTSENISSGEWANKGVYCYDASGNSCKFADLVKGEWYTFYILISNKTPSNPELYVNCWSTFADGSTSGTLTTAYNIRNVGFASVLPTV